MIDKFVQNLLKETYKKNTSFEDVQNSEKWKKFPDFSHLTLQK
jgi:hypothetical protein